MASIFLQLRLSERSGRGVPKIIGRYGKEAIKIEKNRIVVTIPFERIDTVGFNIDADDEEDNVEELEIRLNESQKKK